MMPYELEELQEQEKRTPQKKIANNFIQSVIANNTETALKIVWYLASVFNKCDLKKEFNTFTINEKDITKETGITAQTIKRNLKAMMKTTITFIDEEKRIDKYRQLVPALDIKYDGTIEIDMYSIVAKMIIDVVHDNTTFIDITQLLKLKNKHSIRLLPLLKTISEYDENKGIKKQKTEGLKFWNSLFGTKYTALKYIDTKILSKVKEELDNNSTLTFIYKMNKRPVGKGRPGIQDITIIPTAKNNYQTTIFSNLDYDKTEDQPQKQEPNINKIRNELIEHIDMVSFQDGQTNNHLKLYLLERLDDFIDFIKNENFKSNDYIKSFERHCDGYRKNFKKLDERL